MHALAGSAGHSLIGIVGEPCTANPVLGQRKRKMGIAAVSVSLRLLSFSGFDRERVPMIRPFEPKRFAFRTVACFRQSTARIGPKA
jgi:hypothetical protein